MKIVRKKKREKKTTRREKGMGRGSSRSIDNRAKLGNYDSVENVRTNRYPGEATKPRFGREITKESASVQNLRSYDLAADTNESAFRQSSKSTTGQRTG